MVGTHATSAPSSDAQGGLLPRRRRPSRRVLQVLVLLVCLSVGAALPLVYRDGQSASAGPALSIDPEALNLGTVWQQPALPFRLPIRNVSKQAVRVEQLSATCNCTRLHPQEFEILPGESVDVHGEIDLSRSLNFRGRPEGRLEVQLTARTIAESESKAVEWILRGTVRRAVYVTPATIRFQGPQEIVRGIDASPVTIDGQLEGPVVGLEPPPESAVALVDLSGPDDDGRFQLSVTPRDDLPLGPLESTVVLHTKFADGSPGPEVDIPIIGSVVPPVRLRPDRVTLRMPEGGRAEQDGRPGQSEVARTHLIGMNGKKWFLTGTLDCPPWLNIWGPDPDQDSAIINLTTTEFVSSGTTQTVTVVAESAAGETVHLDLRIAVSRHDPTGRRQTRDSITLTNDSPD